METPTCPPFLALKLMCCGRLPEGPSWARLFTSVPATRTGDGFCEVRGNIMEGFWSLLHSWLRPHQGKPQEKLPLCLGFFQFVNNDRRRGKAPLGALVAGLVA